MDLPILSAAAVGLAMLTPISDASMIHQANEGPADLVGQTLWASEEPLPRWGEPLRAEELSLESLGQVAQVLTSPEGEAEGIVVAVGGLWGVGSQEVRMGMERVHLVPAPEGGTRLVVDLSVAGAEPPVDGEAL